jgi:hypothetical protein
MLPVTHKFVGLSFFFANWLNKENSDFRDFLFKK